MATIYVLSNDEMVYAESPAELVSKLCRASIAPHLTNAAYMQEVAGRCKMYYGREISFENEEKFVDGLLEMHEIKIRYEVFSNE